MISTAPDHSSTEPPRNLWSDADVVSILRGRNWLSETAGGFELCTQEWISRAANLLGPRAPDCDELVALLKFCFHYDSAEILRSPASHVVLAREGARDVIRALALELLSDPAPVDSDRFHALIEALKQKTPSRGRGLFHPIRLVLAGAIGEGELDRVILLLDSAPGGKQLAPVKSTRTRILEFCAALE